MIGTLFKHKRLNPQLAWCSRAVRARETLEIVLKSAKLEVETRFDERIYMASPREILKVLSETEDNRNEILLVGHNPGLEEVLFELSRQDRAMPTCAVAKVALGIEKWSQIGEGKGKLEWFVKPKDLVIPD